MSAESVRMLCTFHGEYPPDRLHACPLCRDELVERVERAEAQLVVVPALVEALRDIERRATSGQHAAMLAREALAAYEQAQEQR